MLNTSVSLAMLKNSCGHHRWAHFQNALFATGTGDHWCPVAMLLKIANHSAGTLGFEWLVWPKLVPVPSAEAQGRTSEDSPSNRFEVPATVFCCALSEYGLNFYSDCTSVYFANCMLRSNEKSKKPSESRCWKGFFKLSFFLISRLQDNNYSSCMLLSGFL